MVGTKESFTARFGWLTALAVAMLLTLAMACGGSDEEKPSSAASNDTNLVPDLAPDESDSIEDDPVVAQDNRVPPSELVIPMVEPESGSDEEAIIGVFEQVMAAIRAEDSAGYLATCNPTKKKLSTAQLDFVFESVFGPYGELAGMSQRDLTIRTFKDDTALTESTFYEYEDVLFERFSYGFSKIDGTWYADSNCGL